MVSVLILDVGQNRDLKPTHRNHIQIVSKPYQNRIKIVSKSFQNHKNNRDIDQKAVPALFPFPFLKPTRREP